MDSENKLHLFRTNINPNKISKYLVTTFGRERRSSLSNLRLGTTDLEIEIGRRFRIPRDARFCKICDSQAVEDEQHFLFECPTLAETRKPFIEKISKISLSFGNLQNADKTNFLFFNDDLTTNIQNIAAELLIALKCIRETKNY